MSTKENLNTVSCSICLLLTSGDHAYAVLVMEISRMKKRGNGLSRGPSTVIFLLYMQETPVTLISFLSDHTDGFASLAVKL